MCEFDSGRNAKNAFNKKHFWIVRVKCKLRHGDFESVEYYVCSNQVVQSLYFTSQTAIQRNSFLPPFSFGFMSCDRTTLRIRAVSMREISLISRKQTSFHMFITCVSLLLHSRSNGRIFSQTKTKKNHEACEAWTEKFSTLSETLMFKFVFTVLSSIFWIHWNIKAI